MNDFQIIDLYKEGLQDLLKNNYKILQRGDYEDLMYYDPTYEKYYKTSHFTDDIEIETALNIENQRIYNARFSPKTIASTADAIKGKKLIYIIAHGALNHFKLKYRKALDNIVDRVLIEISEELFYQVKHFSMHGKNIRFKTTTAYVPYRLSDYTSTDTTNVFRGLMDEL